MSKKQRDPSPSVEVKYDEVRQLVALGRERGFLAYDEINETLPDEISSSTEEIEEFFSLLESHGVAVVDTDAREQLGPGCGRRDMPWPGRLRGQPICRRQGTDRSGIGGAPEKDATGVPRYRAAAPEGARCGVGAERTHEAAMASSSVAAPRWRRSP